MSFGWSAGDIATAVKLIYNVIQALDSCDGAARDYREAVIFLRDLKRTLDPLQSFAAWKAYPSYRKDIEEQVAHIKVPVESFLEAVVKFEPSLGQRAVAGHHRHVFRKLQWYVLVSKKVLALGRKIESHMRVIDTLLQRLTLDIVSTFKAQLPQDLKVVLEETLRPDLMSFLRENLRPLHEKLLADVTKMQESNYEKLTRRLSERYDGLSSDIQWIKELIEQPHLIQEQVESSLSRANASLNQLEAKTLSRTQVNDNIPVDWESLRDVYYLVFLYLGHFLENLFVALSRLVQPPRALMPTLLAKYNITFLDAIGRAPRILPYEYFKAVRILRGFIKEEFRNLPGASWVNSENYYLSMLNGDGPSLGGHSTYDLPPGTTVVMSIILRKVVNSSWYLEVSRCPQKSCLGTWDWIEASTCPICQKEVDTIIDFGQPPYESEQPQNKARETPQSPLDAASTGTRDSSTTSRIQVEDEIAFYIGHRPARLLNLAHAITHDF